MFQVAFYGAILSLFVLTACEVEDSADVNQERIYADYEVFYNSNTDKTWVIARFRFGGPTGTLLELNAPASVSFDGDVLEFNPLFGGHFTELAGQVNQGTFSYTNTNEETFVNSLPAYETIAFPEELDSLSKSSAFDLAWDGTALGANQRVGLFIGSWAFGDDALFLQTEDNATSLVLGTDQLSNLPLGPSNLFMDRSTEVDITEGTSEGGKIRGKYRAPNKAVTIIE